MKLKLGRDLNQWSTLSETNSLWETWKLNIGECKKVILGNESIICKGEK